MTTWNNRLALRLIQWQRQFGRHGLPWQDTRDPFRVWLSEIMLQQTQVSTVLGYYNRFLERWPTVRALAEAEIDDVLSLWAGLGYYARARNLHACARAVVERFSGEFPRTDAELASLPGIGRSTAAAIAAFCFEQRTAILDGNVKRVLARHFSVDTDPSKSATVNALWTIAEQCLPDLPLTRADPRAMSTYTQALMDLGATVCKRRKPLCAQCPLSTTCLAHRDGTTDEIPSKRATKARPTRELHLLWLTHDDHLLMEKRPDKGIWGGLWCLPVVQQAQDIEQEFEQLGAASKSLVRMASFAHELTHFHLILTPWQANCATRTPQALGLSSTLRWIARDELHKHGMPKPIQKLLDLP
jgi:A/G-specific adenine glycosylase